MSDRKGDGTLDLQKKSVELVELFRAIVGHRADAEDMAQTLLERFERARQANLVQNAEAYMWGSVKNTVADFFRRTEREARLKQRLEAREMLREAIEFATSDCEGEAAAEILERARHQMKDIWWQAICMRYAEGLLIAEIAERLGVSVPSVNVYLSKARAIIDQIVRSG